MTPLKAQHSRADWSLLSIQDSHLHPTLLKGAEIAASRASKFTAGSKYAWTASEGGEPNVIKLSDLDVWSHQKSWLVTRKSGNREIITGEDSCFLRFFSSLSFSVSVRTRTHTDQDGDCNMEDHSGLQGRHYIGDPIRSIQSGYIIETAQNTCFHPSTNMKLAVPETASGKSIQANLNTMLDLEAEADDLRTEAGGNESVDIAYLPSSYVDERQRNISSNDMLEYRKRRAATFEPDGKRSRH